MPTIHKAGAIVLSQAHPRNVLLLYRGKQQDWAFPKGHVEAGESVSATTQREIAEETGLSTRLLRALPPMEYPHPSGNHVVVEMFVVQSDNDAPLRAELPGDRLEWVDCREVAVRLSHENVRQYYVSVSDAVEAVIAAVS
jgi:ADP-ribose pyrophosphatase YjhB (NUDIX family)